MWNVLALKVAANGSCRTIGYDGQDKPGHLWASLNAAYSDFKQTVFKIHHTSNLLGYSSHSCLFSRDHGCQSRLALVSPSECPREESSQSHPMAQHQSIILLKGEKEIFCPSKKSPLENARSLRVPKVAPKHLKIFCHYYDT